MRSKRLRNVLAAAAINAICIDAYASTYAVDWGLNSSGQLGNGSLLNSSSPYVISSVGSAVDAIGAGYKQNFAAVNGSLYGWGSNAYGQLGVGYASQTTPTYIPNPTPVIGLDSNVSAVASSASQGYAIQNGGVYAWGQGNFGGLGNGSQQSSYVATPVLGMSSGVSAIFAGSGDCFAVQNGGLFAWGNNGLTQLGTGSTQVINSNAAPVVGMASGVTAVACGNLFTLAIQNGALYAWGDASRGQLGIGGVGNTTRPTPVPVDTLTSGVTAVAAGAENSMAVQNGSVYVSGFDPLYQLYYPVVPVLVSGINGRIVSVASTGLTDYALAADGSIWDWGANSYGQLGLGNTNAYSGPQHLSAPAGFAYTNVSAGGIGSSNTVLAVLARPDSTVSYSASYAPLGSETPVLTPTGENAIANLSVPLGTVFGSVQVAGFLSGVTGTQIVYLGLADPTQAAALVADLDVLYGGNYASVLTNDPFNTPYQVELTIPTTEQSANYFNFDFTTVVNAGSDGTSVGSVQIVNVGVVPEPTGLFVFAAAGVLTRRKRRNLN